MTFHSSKHFGSHFFYDINEYIDFFQQHFHPKTTAILASADTVISVIYLLLCTLFPSHKAFYWYAAGLREDYRGRGIFTKFAKEVCHQSAKKGSYNLCVPVDPLWELYRKIGLVQTYTVSEKQYFSDGIPNVSAIQITLAQPADYQNRFYFADSTIWSDQAIRYAFQKNQLYGEKGLHITCGIRDYVAFACWKEDTLFLDYIDLTEAVFETCKTEIIDYLQCQALFLRSHPKKEAAHQVPVGLTDHPNISPPVIPSIFTGRNTKGIAACFEIPKPVRCLSPSNFN